MASGSRTILLSRWRVGGQSTIDLMREFIQELPHSPAAVAWRRSVQLAGGRVVDPAAEPRLRAGRASDGLKADHPFFWAGYLLVDTGVGPVPEAPAAKPPDNPPEKPVVKPAEKAEERPAGKAGEKAVDPAAPKSLDQATPKPADKK
jgi:hypothetical protein